MTESLIVMDDEQLAKLRAQASPLVRVAQAATVRDEQSYAQAGELALRIRERENLIATFFDPVLEKAKVSVAAAKATEKEAKDQKQRILAPLVGAQAALKQKMVEYLNEQDRRRREEATLAAEATRRAEEAARQAAADQLEAEGRRQAAERVRALPPTPAPPTQPAVRVSAPKVEGVAPRVKWTARVTSLLTLVRAAAENPELLRFLCVDQSMLNDEAREKKEAMSVPGVEAISEREIALANR